MKYWSWGRDRIHHLDWWEAVVFGAVGVQLAVGAWFGAFGL